MEPADIKDIGVYCSEYAPGSKARESLERTIRRIRTTKDSDKKDELTARLTSQKIGNLNVLGWYINENSEVCLELLNGTAETHSARVYRLSEREIEERKRNSSPKPDPKPEFEY